MRTTPSATRLDYPLRIYVSSHVRKRLSIVLGSSEARPTSGRARNKQGHTMTTKIHTETVTTHELVEGDVVHVYGLRVKLGPIKQTFHLVTEHGGATYASRGEVLNGEYLDTPEGHALFGGILTVGESWTVQGNGLATWAREVNA